MTDDALESSWEREVETKSKEQVVRGKNFSVWRSGVGEESVPLSMNNITNISPTYH